MAGYGSHSDEMYWTTAGVGQSADQNADSAASLPQEQIARTVATVREVIERAMLSRSRVWIKYRDYHRNITTRAITPLSWDGPRIRSFCHMQEAERTFNINNVLECIPLEDAGGVIPVDKEQPEPAPGPAQKPLIRPRQQPATSAQTLVEPFRQCNDANQWNRLISYYRDCLEIENREQFIANWKELLVLDSSPRDAHRFLAGTGLLEFPAGLLNRLTPLARFIEGRDKRKDSQLCFGFPLLILEGDQVAPLIYSPADVSRSEEQLILQSEGLEISYAALKKLGFKDEEIHHFLAECDEFEKGAGEDAIQQLVKFVAAGISAQLQRSIHWSDTPAPYTLHRRPALFWVQENTATGKLIEELGQLSNRSVWQRVPEPLRALLSITPAHSYPDAPLYRDDPNVYVTAVNSRQILGVTAAEQEQLTVVTGPPGTGKSQLVLNVIANAFFRGERVLFASRNNKAVDVVMDRLLGELGFRGAVRTGNRAYRLSAAAQIRSALESATIFDAPLATDGMRERYQSGRDSAIRARMELEQVRELTGLLQSREIEREKRLALLPRPVARYAVKTVPGYNVTDIDRLRADLWGLLRATLELKERHSRLQWQLIKVISENLDGDPIIDHLKDYENQWGTLGDEFLHRDSFMTIADLQRYLQAWLELLAALEAHENLSRKDEHCRQTRERFIERIEGVAQSLRTHIEGLATEHKSAELLATAEQFEKLRSEFERIAGGRLSLWERLFVFLRIRNPHVQASRVWRALSESVKIDHNGVNTDDPEAIAVACSQAADLLNASVLQQQLWADQTACEAAQAAYSMAAGRLSESVQADLGRMKPISSTVSPLRSVLTTRLESANQLQMEADQLAARTNSLLAGNASQSRMIAQFKETRGGRDRRLWRVRVPVILTALVSHLTKWQNLVSFWEEDTAVTDLQSKLEVLPSEEDAQEAVKRTGIELLELAGEYLRGSWLDQTRQVTNEELRRAGDYASAMEILAGEGGYDPSAYGRAKSTEESAFTSALSIFPIWATTNLSTKTNFPLEAELFDLLIIDEASQCDVPSALPLLYRAKRAMIIGDPNQLRHVATISEDADVQAAFRFGVAHDAFLYRNRSLFDLAMGSVGTQPGTLLLDEHFRSDARIIQFSNLEFYDGRLAIKTDLTLSRGVRRSFLNTYGGMYWLNVPGSTQHPEGRGSAYNMSELQTIGALVPRLRGTLRSLGMGDLEIGIVTPYREQEGRLLDLLPTMPPGSDILAGTAHKFQGDERDIIIFSPVLAPGIKPGSLDWLARTRNLLNVALTRARLAVVVVGDWHFCCSLAADNPFRKLVGYVQGLDKGLYEKMDDLPLLGGQPYDIVGYVLDPHNPEHSKATLRRFLTCCREYVWWFDPYFDDRVIQLFWDVFQGPDSASLLQQVRLLTTQERIQSPGGAKPNLRPETVRSLRHDLASRGVELEMRSLPKNELPVHDRLLFHPGRAINMPPLGNAIGEHLRVSEYTLSNVDQTLFEELWQRAQPVG